MESPNSAPMPENPYQPPREVGTEREEEVITWRYVAEYILWTVVGFAILIGLCFGTLALISP